jgi:ribosomal protein S18 acetylase RimI-like enzyme
MTTTSIRTFKAREFADWRRAFDAYYEEGKVPTPSLKLTRKNWRDIHDRKHPLKAYGIWYKGELAGFIVWASVSNPHSLKPFLYISDLYVLPDFRRKQLGTKLLKKVFAMVGPRHSHIEWKTRHKNVVAQRLYKKYAKKTNWIIYERHVTS